MAAHIGASLEVVKIGRQPLSCPTSQGGPGVRSDMEFWKEVRRRVLTKEISQRAACTTYGLGWHTLKKILAHDEPPGYRQSQLSCFSWNWKVEPVGLT